MYGHFPLPLGPFEFGKWTLVSCPLSRIQICIILICLFSHWVDAFPCHRSTASAVSKYSQKRSSPTGESSQSSIATREQENYTICLQDLVDFATFSCAYHPQSCDLVGQTNRITKTQNRKPGRFF